MADEAYGTRGPYIGGTERGGTDRFEVRDPSTGEAIAEVADAGPSGIDEAVDVAREADDEWSSIDTDERGRILRAIADEMREASERLVRIESAETGRPEFLSQIMVEGAAAYFDYYAGVTDKLEGETIPVPGDHVDFTVREPLGVTGHVVPWNAALKLGTRSIAPALACGNTAVAKPAPEAPLSMLEFGRLAAEAGLPDGVLNVVPGDGPNTGAALTGHDRLDGLSFTGSRSTGKRVMQAAAENVVPVTLELGGKSPNIVFPDADLDAAAEGTVKAFLNAGQICYAPTRVFVHESIYDRFTERIVRGTERMAGGTGGGPSKVGPLITQEALDRVAGYVDDAIEGGGTILTGGEVADGPGYFFEPTIIEGVDDDAPISCEEVFGPVLTVYSFGSESEAVGRANDTEYGLYGVVWTKDVDRAHRVVGELEAGTVVVNDFPVTYPQAPFGGYKQSGIGREHGLRTLEHYTRVKNVAITVGDLPDEGGG